MQLSIKVQGEHLVSYDRSSMWLQLTCWLTHVDICHQIMKDLAAFTYNMFKIHDDFNCTL